MPELMLSYKREDRAFADKLANVLKQRGVDVWYDRNLRPNQSFSHIIDDKIITSDAVLVVWSKLAGKSRWVMAEALRAADLDKLIHVKCEPCDLTVPFNATHCEDLSSWNGDSACEEIDNIVNAVKQRTGQQIAVADDAVVGEDILEIHRILKNEARVQVTKLLATGQISHVYLGRSGSRLVAVKALNAAELSSSGGWAELTKEIELSANLQHPSFLRIYQTFLHKERCFLVTDFFEGETLERKLAQKTDQPVFTIEDVIDLLEQLTAAIAEAHARGMQYLRITPADILIRTSKIFDRQVARIAPINLKYFAECRRMGDELHWRDDAGPFMAPELWKETSWRDAQADADSDDGASLRAMHQKANQFALGMMAWTMIEGAAPTAQQIPKHGYVLTKVNAFLKVSKGFSGRVLDAPWRGQARALASIIARMVSTDPARRWQDMTQVNLLMRALAADRAAGEFKAIVKNVYDRICARQQDFYADFYANFFKRARREVAALFKPGNMAHQHQMLHVALSQLLNFDQQQLEPTTLARFVEEHKKRRLTADDFVQFGEALIETFDKELRREPDHHRMIAALEIIIWPGIHYLTQKCVMPHQTAPGSRNPAPPDRKVPRPGASRRRSLAPPATAP